MPLVQRLPIAPRLARCAGPPAKHRPSFFQQSPSRQLERGRRAGVRFSTGTPPRWLLALARERVTSPVGDPSSPEPIVRRLHRFGLDVSPATSPGSSMWPRQPGPTHPRSPDGRELVRRLPTWRCRRGLDLRWGTYGCAGCRLGADFFFFTPRGTGCGHGRPRPLGDRGRGPGHARQARTQAVRDPGAGCPMEFRTERHHSRTWASSRTGPSRRLSPRPRSSRPMPESDSSAFFLPGSSGSTDAGQTSPASVMPPDSRR